jgi:transglutaminase-like putative cysteine protease
VSTAARNIDVHIPTGVHVTAPIDPTSPPGPGDLAPTGFLDADDARVVDFARSVTASCGDDASRTAALFAEVRDRIWYDPHDVSRDPADYRASSVLAGRQRWCVPKSVLLSTACRAVGIPARLGFADVRNHLQSTTLRERMGTDVFYWHGYSVLWVDGRWRKASPAFNRELCDRFGTEPLDFDGRRDALLHAHAGDGTRHMEYLGHRGIYDDLPLDEILSSFGELYGAVLPAVGDDPMFTSPP